jgi:hypothetical protein
MAKIPIKDGELLTREIRQLLKDGNSIDYICTTLDINRRTFFRYKKKIIKEIIKEYKPEKNEVQIQHSLLRDRLEQAEQVNLQIMTNPSFSPMARSNASEKAVIYRVQLTKLTEEGYLNRPILPALPSLSMDRVVVLGEKTGEWVSNGKRTELKN